jgi:hypothetical protein
MRKHSLTLVAIILAALGVVCLAVAAYGAVCSDPGGGPAQLCLDTNQLICDQGNPVSIAMPNATRTATACDTVTISRTDICQTTAAANAIPCADTNGKIATDWLPIPLGTGILYFDDATEPVPGYGVLALTPVISTEDIDSVTINSASGETLIAQYVTESWYPGTTVWQGGVWYIDLWRYVSITSGTTTITVKVYKRDSVGIETLLFTADTGDINNTTNTYQELSTTQGDFLTNADDRLVAKLYATTTHPSNVTVSFTHNGTSHYSHIHTPLSIIGVSTGKVAAANGDGSDYLYQKLVADTDDGVYLSLEGAPPSQTVQIHSQGLVSAANGDGNDYLYQKLSADTSQGLYTSLEGAPPNQTVQIHQTVGSLVAGSNVILSKVTATGTGTATGTVTSLSSTDTGTITVVGGSAAITVGQGLSTSTQTDSSTKISMRVPELESVQYLMGFEGTTMSSFTLVSPGVWEHTDAIALTGSSFVESGITVNAGDRILVAQPGTTGNTLKRCQSSANGGISNGIFEVISPGEAGVTKPRISRDYDAMAETDFVDGMMVVVRTGALHSGSHWRYKHFGSFTLDTDKVCFDEYGGAYDTSVKDVNVLLSDTTGNNASTDNHGFLPKLSGSQADVMRGDGSWGSPTTSQTVSWVLAYSVDFAAQADQTVTSNGNYTIDGKTWTTSNYASATTFTIGTTGGGIYIAHSSANTSDLGTTFTCPTIAANVANLSSDLTPETMTDMFVMVNSVYTVAPNQNYERYVIGLALNTADDNTPATTSWKIRVWPVQYNGTYSGFGATHIGVTTPPSSTSDVYSGTFTGGVNNTYDATGFWQHMQHSIRTFRGQMSGGNFPTIGTSSWEQLAETVPVTTTYVIQGAGGRGRRTSVYFSACTQGGNGANDAQIKKLAIYLRKAAG